MGVRVPARVMLLVVLLVSVPSWAAIETQGASIGATGIPPASDRRVIDVAAGDLHTCALLDSGNVRCWGDDQAGQSHDRLAGDAIAITAGARHTCALTRTHQVVCWGDNDVGQSAGYETQDAQAIAAGSAHTCVLTDGGNVWCWGDDRDGGTAGYDGGDAVALAAGGGHTCVVVARGDVHCWGADWHGQSQPYTEGDAVQVSAGARHTCALTETGSVVCWGNDCCGETGGYQRLETDGNDPVVHCRPTVPTMDLVDQPRPYGCAGTTAAVGIESGARHSCALLADGNLTCWGATDGPVGGYSYGDAVGYAGGDAHGCILLAGGTVTCRGASSEGQAAGYPPTRARQVATGTTHSCIIDNGTVHCWGEVVDAPFDRSDVVEVAAGPRQTCVRLRTGDVQCQGNADPTDVSSYGGRDAVQLGVGGSHACALRADGGVSCWGDMDAPETTDYEVVPGATRTVTCDGPRGPPVCTGSVPAVEVALGDRHTCIRLADGRVYCWGGGYNGNLRPEPVPLVDQGASLLRAGWDRACAIVVDGEVRCWQDDYAVRSMDWGSDVVVDLSVGEVDICALFSSGEVECQGDGAYGGPPSTSSGDVVQLAAGARHACTLHADGSAQCWGDNALGQAAGFTPQPVASRSGPEDQPTLGVLVPAVAAAVVIGAVGFGAMRTRNRQPAATPVPGRTFLGKYQVIRRIGLGGVGTVWLAQHTRLKRRVVLKQLRPELTASPEVVQRFDREAEVLASLDHPNITRVFDVEDVAESRFIVMEFLDGGTLRDLVVGDPRVGRDEPTAPTAADMEVVKPTQRSRRAWWSKTSRSNPAAPLLTEAGAPQPHSAPASRPDVDRTTAGGMEPITREAPALARSDLAPDQAVRIMLDVLAGLEYIHTEGILHRDLKPSNILLADDGQAKIADFGVARSATDAGPGVTVATFQPGTPRFMAPEQLSGQAADERTDIYAAGATLYWSLTGRSHIKAGPQTGLVELHRRILEDSPDLPVPDVPRAVNEWLTRCLAKDPTERFASAASARKALQRAANRFPSTTLAAQ